jgi:hypothetical protein
MATDTHNGDCADKTLRRAAALDDIDRVIRETPVSTPALERIAAIADSVVRAERDRAALDDIAHLLRDPADWDTRMLDDIAALIRSTGRPTGDTTELLRGRP